jgi:hypothetical protein
MSRGRVTVEEALLAVVGAIALVLFFLGLSEVLEGDPRARLRARRRLMRGQRLRPGGEAGAPRALRAPLARRLGTAAIAPADGSVPPRAERTHPEPAGALAGERPMAVGGAPRLDPVAEDWREGVATLIRRREFGEARRLIEPALAGGAVSHDTVGFLLEACSTAIARDLWRLRRGLRRGGGDEVPLTGSMETARVLLDSRPAAGLPPTLRLRVARGLWRGHTRLGLRRWRAGEFDTAAGTLFQALSVPGIDDRRRRLARDLAVRTLEDMAGQSLELIPQLLGDRDRAAALERAQRLLTQIRRARDEGVSPENLAVAASRARQLLEHIEQAPVR